MRLLLKIPNEDDKQIVERFRDEFMSVSDTPHIPGASTLIEFPYEQWLAHIRKDIDNPGEGRVKATQYIALNDENTVVGVIQLREALTPWLEKFGGHIGYAVHPHYRKKGYASEMLQQVLNKARQMKLKEVLITCTEGNIGSEKTILKCGGVYINSLKNDNCETKKRFVISL